MRNIDKTAFMTNSLLVNYLKLDKHFKGIMLLLEHLRINNKNNILVEWLGGRGGGNNVEGQIVRKNFFCGILHIGLQNFSS